jgi:hypothetical protein
MKAEDHCFTAIGPMQSLYLFVVKDVAEVSKDIQGEIRTTPRRGAESWIAGMGREVEGCGCEIWERRERARFAPAESPVNNMFEGEISSLVRTWCRRAEACCSWRG